jgi:hypothetical protein
MSNITNIQMWLANVNLRDNLIFQIKQMRVSEGSSFIQRKAPNLLGRQIASNLEPFCLKFVENTGGNTQFLLRVYNDDI